MKGISSFLLNKKYTSASSFEGNKAQEIQREKSEELFKTAKQCFPGGVNSPVRAFKSVGGTPLFIQKGEGPYIWDADDNQYIDFCCSWGPLILGHAHPKVVEAITETAKLGTTFGAPTELENELASLILKHNKYIDKVRFLSSGTEAVMSAIRLARGYTGKTKIIKFDGCYHGHVDSLLVNAGSGLVTFGQSSSAGIPESFVRETLVLPLNNIGAIQEALYKHASEIAAVIIEPIPANNGLLIQAPEFLTQLRELCTKNNILLIFDEVISGFRVGFEGAAAFYNIQPDITTYGKIIGGGLPVGCYGGKAEIMARISPEGDVYQAGTLSGNPMAMAAGIATLKELLAFGFYKNLNAKTKEFADAINRFALSQNYEFRVHQIGSIFWFAFSKEEIRASADINPDSMKNFRVMHKMLLDRGIYLGPSGYEVGFISSEHSKNDLEVAKRAIFNALDLIFKP